MIIKGCMVSLQIGEISVYGTVLSIVEGMYYISYFCPISKELVTKPKAINEIVKIGSHIKKQN